jgi:hypothetical protein
MAFGKKDDRLGKMNLRQQMRHSAKRVPRGGGGGAPFYINQYRPPVTGSADIIRLIPGQYAVPRVDPQAKDLVYDENNQVVMDEFPFYKYIEYYHAPSKRRCVGSEGPLGEFKGKGQPCIAADWFWYEWRQRNRTKPPSKHPNSLSRREMYALTVLVQAPFYNAPQTDKDGNVKTNQQGDPYLEWKQGSKRGNDDLAAGGYERKDGHLMHWSLGFAHWKVLTDYADSLAHHCRACGGHDCIQDVALLCQNCGDSVVEMQETTLSDEEIARLKNEEVLCRHCKYNGYLEELIRCTECNNGEQATLFDFDLEVKRTETATEGGNQTVLSILRAIGPRPIDAIYGEDLRKPLDLLKIYAPTSLDRQRDMLGEVPPDDAPPAQQQGGARNPSNRGSRAYGS